MKKSNSAHVNKDGGKGVGPDLDSAKLPVPPSQENIVNLRSPSSLANAQMPPMNNEPEGKIETAMDKVLQEFRSYVTAQTSKRHFAENLQLDTDGKGKVQDLIEFIATREEFKDKFNDFLGYHQRMLTNPKRLKEEVLVFYRLQFELGYEEYITTLNQKKIESSGSSLKEETAALDQELINSQLYGVRSVEIENLLNRYTYGKLGSGLRISFMEFIEDRVGSRYQYFAGQYPDDIYANHTDISAAIVNQLVLEFAAEVNLDAEAKGLIDDLETYSTTKQSLLLFCARLPVESDAHAELNIHLQTLRSEYIQEAKVIDAELYSDYSQSRRDEWISGVFQRWLDYVESYYLAELLRGAQPIELSNEGSNAYAFYHAALDDNNGIALRYPIEEPAATGNQLSQTGEVAALVEEIAESLEAQPADLVSDSDDASKVTARSSEILTAESEENASEIIAQTEQQAGSAEEQKPKAASADSEAHIGEVEQLVEATTIDSKLTVGIVEGENEHSDEITGDSNPSNLANQNADNPTRGEILAENQQSAPSHPTDSIITSDDQNTGVKADLVGSIVEDFGSALEPLYEEFRQFANQKRNFVEQQLAKKLGADADCNRFMHQLNIEDEKYITELNALLTQELPENKRKKCYLSIVKREIAVFCEVEKNREKIDEIDTSLRSYLTATRGRTAIRLLSDSGGRGNLEDFHKRIESAIKANALPFLSEFEASRRSNWEEERDNWIKQTCRSYLNGYIEDINIKAGTVGLVDDVRFLARMQSNITSSKLTSEGVLKQFDAEEFDQFIVQHSEKAAAAIHRQLSRTYSQEEREKWINQQFDALVSKYIVISHPAPIDYLTAKVNDFATGKHSTDELDQRTAVEVELAATITRSGNFDDFLIFLNGYAKKEAVHFAEKTEKIITPQNYSEDERKWIAETYSVALATYVDLQDTKAKAEQILTRLVEFSTKVAKQNQLSQEQHEFIYDSSRFHAVNFYKSISGEQVSDLKYIERRWIKDRYQSMSAEFKLLSDGNELLEHAFPAVVEETRAEQEEGLQVIQIRDEAKEQLISELTLFAAAKENRQKFDREISKLKKFIKERNLEIEIPTFEDFALFLSKRAYPTCENQLKRQQIAARKSGPKLYSDTVDAWAGSHFYTGLRTYERCLKLGMSSESLLRQAEHINIRYASEARRTIDINFNSIAAGDHPSLSSTLPRAAVYNAVFQSPAFSLVKDPRNSALESFYRYKTVAEQARKVVGAFHHEAVATAIIEGKYTYNEAIEHYSARKAAFSLMLSEYHGELLSNRHLDEKASVMAVQHLLREGISGNPTPTPENRTEHKDQLELLGLHHAVIDQANGAFSLESVKFVNAIFEQQFIFPEQCRYVRNQVISSVIESSGEQLNPTAIEEMVQKCRIRFDGLWGNSRVNFSEPVSILVTQQSLWMPDNKKLTSAAHQYMNLRNDARQYLENFQNTTGVNDLQLLASIVEGTCAIAARSVLLGEDKNVAQAIESGEARRFINENLSLLN